MFSAGTLSALTEHIVFNPPHSPVQLVDFSYWQFVISVKLICVLYKFLVAMDKSKLNVN